MKDEGTFDDLRRACLECLEKNASFISLRSDFDGDVDHFLSKQKWKNAAEYKEQARRELRKHALQTQIMTKLMPKLIHDVIKNYSNEILVPKVTEKVNYLMQQHDESTAKRKLQLEQDQI